MPRLLFVCEALYIYLLSHGMLQALHNLIQDYRQSDAAELMVRQSEAFLSLWTIPMMY
jgi:hypothetical protein